MPCITARVSRWLHARTFAKQCICNKHSFAIICIHLMRIPWKFVTYCAHSPRSVDGTSRTAHRAMREMVLGKGRVASEHINWVKFEETLHTIWAKWRQCAAHSAKMCSIQRRCSVFEWFENQTVAIKSKVFRTRKWQCYTAAFLAAMITIFAMKRD